MSLAALFPDGPGALEPLLANLAVRLLGEGAEREVELLAAADAQLLHTRDDPKKGDQYCLCLVVPERLFARAAPRQATIEERLLEGARSFLPAALRGQLHAVSLAPRLLVEPSWRERARAWATGARTPPSGLPASRAAGPPPVARSAAPTPRATVAIGGTPDPPPPPERTRVCAPPRPKEAPLPIGERYKWTRIV